MPTRIDWRKLADLLAMLLGLLLVFVSLAALDWRLGGVVVGMVLIALALLPMQGGEC